MKQSRYNFISHYGDYGYWFNALTGAYFRLSSSLSHKIKHLLDNVEQIQELSPNAFKQLVDFGFVVPDDTDELESIRTKHRAAVNAKDYFLIILPTLNCNFSCWYCIQDHIPSIMADVTLESILRHIDHMIDNEHISSLHLEWFGGEPFMFFDKIIVPISRYAIQKCEACNIPFTNNSTTNGYFLNQSVSSMLQDLKFKHFQITLDGNRKFHDNVKFMRGCDSAFDHVLTNINNILSDNDNISIHLRINYTHTTLSSAVVDEVCQFIQPQNRNRIVIMPRKVWQEKVDKDFSSILTEILDNFAANGFQVSRGDVSPTFTSCYVNRKYYNAINFNGNVVKCTACNDLYETTPKGQLMFDGTIQWRDNYDLRCQEATFENERCLECKNLPLCMGQCPRTYMNGNTQCKYDSEDGNIETNILNFLVHEYDA